MKQLRSTKAQALSKDFVIAVSILIIGLVIYFTFLSSQTKDDYAELVQESQLVSQSLISAGFPTNWTSTDIIKPGLTDSNYIINQNKLTEFQNLDHDELKSLLLLKHNLYVFIETRDNQRTVLTGTQPSDTTNLIKTTRLLFHNNDIVKLVIYVWE